MRLAGHKATPGPALNSGPGVACRAGGWVVEGGSLNRAGLGFSCLSRPRPHFRQITAGRVTPPRVTVVPASHVRWAYIPAFHRSPHPAGMPVVADRASCSLTTSASRPRRRSGVGVLSREVQLWPVSSRARGSRAVANVAKSSRILPLDGHHFRRPISPVTIDSHSFSHSPTSGGVLPSSSLLAIARTSEIPDCHEYNSLVPTPVSSGMAGSLEHPGRAGVSHDRAETFVAESRSRVPARVAVRT